MKTLNCNEDNSNKSLWLYSGVFRATAVIHYTCLKAFSASFPQCACTQTHTHANTHARKHYTWEVKLCYSNKFLILKLLAYSMAKIHIQFFEVLCRLPLVMKHSFPHL